GVVRLRQEVDALRWPAARVYAHRGREVRIRDQVVAQPVDERLSRLVAVLVLAGDDHLLVAAARIDEPRTSAGLHESNLRVRLDLRAQPLERRLHSRPAGTVDDDLGGRERAGPDRSAQDVEAAHGRRGLWDS